MYKLHGRVLVKQDVSEARTTVNSRLDFIRKELAKVEANAKTQQAKLAVAKRDILEAQKRIAAPAGAAAPAPR